MASRSRLLASLGSVASVWTRERLFCLIRMGQAKVIGRGCAWFIDSVENAYFADATRPVELQGVTVHKVAPGHAFNVKTWKGDSSDYVLSVDQGKLHSAQPGGAIY